MIAIDSAIPSRVAGTVRNAEPRDLPELGRLFAGVNIDARVIHTAAQGPCGHLLVLDVEGTLRAAVYVMIEPIGRRAELQLLVIDAGAPALRKPIEDRMLGVAMAMCDAYACLEVEIVAAPRHTTAAHDRTLTTAVSRSA